MQLGKLRQESGYCALSLFFGFVNISESFKVNVLVLLTGVQNVAFFSAISAKGLPKSKGKKQASVPVLKVDGSNDEVLTSCQQHKSSVAFASCDCSRREITSHN